MEFKFKFLFFIAVFAVIMLNVSADHPASTEDNTTADNRTVTAENNNQTGDNTSAPDSPAEGAGASVSSNASEKTEDTEDTKDSDYVSASKKEEISSMSEGIEKYYKKESELSSANKEVDLLSIEVEKLEGEIMPLNEIVNALKEQIEETNTEVIDLEIQIKNLKNDISVMKSKIEASKEASGTGDRIAGMIIPFIIGLWVSSVVLIFVWRGE